MCVSETRARARFFLLFELEETAAKNQADGRLLRAARMLSDGGAEKVAILPPVYGR